MVEYLSRQTLEESTCVTVELPPLSLLATHAHSLDPHPCQLLIPAEERKRPCGPFARESAEVMCHSVQGKKGDQYCERGVPKGMT